MNDSVNMNSIKNVSTKKLQNKTLILYVLFLLSGVLFSSIRNPILGSITVLLVCATVYIRPAEENFYLIFGLQFIRVIIPLNLGSSVFGLMLPLYAVLVLKFLVTHKSLCIEQLMLLMILFIDIAVSGINGVFKIGDNINWVFSLIYVIYILKYYTDKIDFERLFLFFLLAQSTICIVNIIAEFQTFGQSLVPNMYGIHTAELGAFAFGKAYPSIAGGNGIGFNNSLAVALCIIMLPKAKSVLQKIFYTSSIVFLGYCGVLAISRGFYVELLIFIALLLLASAKKPSRFIAYTVLICAIIGIVYFVAYDDILVVLERVFTRFESGNEDRDSLILSALHLLKDDIFVLLFGAGSYYPDVYSFTAHNIYLDSIVSLGIIFGVLYWGIIFSTIIKTVKKHGSFTILGCIPLIMLFTYKYISGSTRDVGFYYYIAMCTLFATYITKGEKASVKESNKHINTDL